MKNPEMFTPTNFKFAAFVKSSPLSRVTIRVHCVSRVAVCSASSHSSETIPSLCSALTADPWHFSLCFRLSACWKSHDSEQGWKQAHAHFTSGQQWVSRQQPDKGLQWHLWASQWETQSWPLSDFSYWQLWIFTSFFSFRTGKMTKWKKKNVRLLIK